MMSGLKSQELNSDAQAAKYTDEPGSVVKNNCTPLSTDWVYWFWKAWKKN